LAAALVALAGEVSGRNLAVDNFQSLPDALDGVACCTGHPRDRDTAMRPHRAEGTEGVLGVAAHVVHHSTGGHLIAKAEGDENTRRKRLALAHAAPSSDS